MTQSAVNLPEALQSTAQRCWQLLANAGDPLIGGIGAVQSGERFTPSWPSADRVEFRRAVNEYAAIIFTNIHETGYKSIQWLNEEVIGRADEFQTIDRVEGFPEGAMYNQRHVYTFGAVESLLDTTKNAFETEAEARLGSISTPVGAKLAQTVTAEYTKQRGDTNNWQQTVERTFSFPIVEDFEIRAVRAAEKRRVHVIGVPMLDFGIEWGAFYPNGSYDRSGVASISEFLQLLAGDAPDTVGVIYRYRPDGQHGEVASVGAELFRSRPQTSAYVPRMSELISFTREYQAVLSQGFRYYSLTDGEYKMPPLLDGVAPGL